ncbi:MAG: hypothetical protein QXO51_07055 [Halobacteria archaeon]
MVPPVFVALGLAAPLLALMGLINALGKWAAEVLGRARSHSCTAAFRRKAAGGTAGCPTAPSPAGVPGLRPSPASGSPSGGVPVKGGRSEPEPA